MKIFRKIKQAFCKHDWILVERNPDGTGVVIWQRLYCCSKCGKDGKVVESKFVITVPGLKRAQAKMSEVFHAPQEQIFKDCFNPDKKWIKR